jgi:hypothetical protein
MIEATVTATVTATINKLRPACKQTLDSLIAHVHVRLGRSPLRLEGRRRRTEGAADEEQGN